ncbi:hypothetical protein P3T83_21415 [Pseudocitrobacter sp. 2023EL-00150]|uniref:hypothetical protein n=1 Tax=Pseudocitrobacter sp. 2023EL-00150 TaxID=3032322 RepID=UPI0023E417A6|nr:hypothetical protein [Pseudocitrobacter sp. 2023EL-00150]MDF3830260.1 hypothetical protein [Pseudocitrobacter sp. 2023EL-00150]
MSACMAVVLNGNTEVKYFPFHDDRSADNAEALADQWRSNAIGVIGQDEADCFHLRVVRPMVRITSIMGHVYESYLDDVEFTAPDPEGHTLLMGFGYSSTLGFSLQYCALSDTIEYIA